MTSTCLFCGGDRSEPGHLLRCDGRQGAIEAAVSDPSAPVPRSPGLADPPVLDAVRGEALKQAGIAHADLGASGEFKERALEAVERLAQRRAEFTSDDVWVALDGQTSRDNRALGPVMKRAQGLRLIAPTGAFVLTAQARRHRSPVRVWRSLLFGVA